MPTFIIRCENLIVERGELEVEAGTVEEALAFARDPKNREDLNYWFSDTAASSVKVVGKQDEDDWRYFDLESDEEVNDPDAFKGSISVDNFSYFAAYAHVAQIAILEGE